MKTRWIKRVLLPSSNRFIYWLFFFLAFLINLAEDIVWYGWIVNPLFLGWFAVGLKSIFVYQSPLEFRHRLGKSIDILVGIFVSIVLFLTFTG